MFCYPPGVFVGPRTVEGHGGTTHRHGDEPPSVRVHVLVAVSRRDKGIKLTDHVDISLELDMGELSDKPG